MARPEPGPAPMKREERLEFNADDEIEKIISGAGENDTTAKADSLDPSAEAPRPVDLDLDSDMVLVTPAAVVSSGPTDSLDDFFSELDGIRSGDSTAPPKSNDAQRSSPPPAAVDFDFDDLGDFAKVG